MDSSDDILLMIAVSDDESEIALVIRKGTGEKLTMNEFLLELEAYLHETTQAQLAIEDGGAKIH